MRRIGFMRPPFEYRSRDHREEKAVQAHLVLPTYSNPNEL